LGAVLSVVLSALPYLVWQHRRRQRPKRGPFFAQRKERRARFSNTNPLRGKQLPKPPKGSPPMHARLSFEKFQKEDTLDTFAIANPLILRRKARRS